MSKKSLQQGGIADLSTAWAEGRRGRFWGLLLMALTFLIYGNTLRNGYNMDDELVTLNHRLTSHGLSAIPDLFTSPYYADEQGYSYEYRPITHLTFAFEHAVFGESPLVGHLINVILYGLTVMLVLLITKGMFPDRSIVLPLCATLLFLVHPMHSEAVASIKNREELLSLLGGLLALLATLRFVQKGKLVWLIVMPLALSLGLLSKLSVLPFVVILPISVIAIGGTAIQLGVTTALMCAMLGTVLWLRTGVGLQAIIAMIAGLMVLAVTTSLVFRPSGILSRLRANAIRTLTYPNDSVEGHSGLGLWTILTGLLSTGLIINGIALEQRLLIIISVGILFLHPLFLGKWVLWLLTLGTMGLAALAPATLHSKPYLPFYFMALAVLFIFRSESWLRRTAHWSIVVTVVAGMVALWHFAGLKWGGIVSKLVFVSFVFLSAQRSISKRLPWLKVTIVVILAVSTALTMIKGFKWEVGLLTIGIVASEFIVQKLKARQIFGIALLLAALVSVSLLPMASRQAIQGYELALPAESDSGGVEPDKQRSALDLFLGNDIDRPLSYAEYPLGFDAEVSTRIGTASAIMGHYLKMMFIPWPQSFYYGFDEVPVTDMKNPWAILSAVIHLLLLILSLVLARSHPIFSFGIIAYLASIFLFSNLVSPVAGMIGDRLTYVASFGFCLALGYVFHLLFEKFNSGIGRKVVTAAFVLLLVSWGGMTIARNAQWKDALTLMRNDIKHVPNSAQAHNLLASHLMKNSFEPEYASEAISMRQEAIGHFKQAVRIWPEFFNVWYDIGRAYMTINQPDNALPAYKEAHRLDSTFYDATINVAIISEQRGNIPQAIDYYERCIRINPEMREPYGNLSYLLFREGRFEESAAVNELAIIQHPAWKDPYLNLSRTYQALGDAERANDYALRAQQMP